MTDEGLVRSLGPIATAALVPGAVVGSGIFLAPSLVAREVGAPGLALAVWAVCGLVAIAGGLCYAELGAALPRSGGTYAFLLRAFGRRWLPFLFGWSMFAVVLTGVTAAVATAFAIYAGHFLGGLMPWGPWAERGVAVATLLVLAALNIAGVRSGGRVQVVLTAAKLGGLVALVVAGLAAAAARGAAGGLAPWSSGSPPGATLVGFGGAMIVALFAYNGWWYATLLAGEVRAPQRSIPVAIGGGLGVVVALYLLANFVYLTALPFADLAASERPAAAAMTRLLGPSGADLIAAAVMVSALGTLNAQLLAAPRIYFAMARDGLFFAALGQPHPRFHTPALAIALHALVAAGYALGGGFRRIVTYTAFPNYAFLALGVVALLVLRRREPGLARPFRVPLYPWLPLLFLLVLGGYLASSLLHSPRETLVGVVLTLAGLPAYAWARRRRGVAGREMADVPDTR